MAERPWKPPIASLASQRDQYLHKQSADGIAVRCAVSGMQVPPGNHRINMMVKVGVIVFVGCCICHRYQILKDVKRDVNR